VTWDIIGMGAIANAGATPEEIYETLCRGAETKSELRAFNLANYRAQYAYEIDDRAQAGKDEPHRASRWLKTAVSQALADAGLDEDQPDIPILVGTTLREQRSAELWWREGVALDVNGLHFGPALSEGFGSWNNYTVANACAAALCTLAMATDMIELGQADTVVVAGADVIAESAFGALDRVQNDTPQALRPFDVTHSGMLMGEGAVAVVVRASDESKGDEGVHARVRGVGMNCDAHHPTAPDLEGITWALRDAHRRAGLGPDDIDLVMMHGTGTPANDSTEATALSKLFAESGTGGPLLTAIKSMTGHTLGGSGLLSLLVAVLAMRHGKVPPVLGLTEPIEEAANLRLVKGGAQSARINTAQVDSFGFGGINAVAIVEAVR
jgi:3-oxoacyl-[acyl-carrier-protein] synthase II